jgi:cytochrome c553
VKKWLKRFGGIFLGLLVALLTAAASVWIASGAKLSAGRHIVQPRPIEIPDGPREVERGRHLVTAVLACAECHGEDLGGNVMLDEQPMGRLTAPNLTRGAGGVALRYNDLDWVRALRHGVASDGRALVMMPVVAYSQIDDDDLGAVVAYLKTLPPVDRNVGPIEPGLLARALIAFGDIPIDAEDLDHSRVGMSAPDASETESYGDYLARVAGCRSCHGQALTGQEIQGHAAAPDITRDGLSGWSREDFARAMREGRTPAGAELDRFMPWRAYAGMTDTEIGALWMFLQAFDPAREGGMR